MKLVKNLVKKFKGKTYDERMHDFLSQATSREHLEYLETVWFKKNPMY